ncbi:hypothetical protein DFH09DRAFT_1124773 [Mycena vulgaris]|nr:hypothetical protein DFH09DRAFT_1124773 [Mycena vulgaris]
MSNTVLITGAAGWLGGLLAEALIADPKTPNIRLILADIVEPKAPKFSTAVTIKADLTAKEPIDSLFKSEFGVPDTIYCLHGIMSRGSEDNFDLGLKVNIDSIRLMLQAAREFGAKSPIKFVFTSSLAPHTVTPETIATPEGAYGMGKLTSELLVNEYSRRGFIDWAYYPPSHHRRVIREPLKGIECLCPIGDSIDSPELELPSWVASPETTIKNFVQAKHVPADKFLTHTRVVCLPGFTATVRDELKALEKVGGKKALDLVKFKDDPINRRIVSSWPPRFDNTYPLSLGFVVDEGGMEPIVRQFQKDIEAGIA